MQMNRVYFEANISGQNLSFFSMIERLGNLVSFMEWNIQQQKLG